MSTPFLQKLEAALRLELPYPERPPVTTGTPASVLLLFGYELGRDSPQSPESNYPLLLITRRTEQVEKHKGQMAFPGGMQEPRESELEAALRETEEEVGVSRERIKVVGALPKLWTITDFWVTPLVGVLSSAVSETPIQFNPAEIAETLWVPLSTFQSSETYRKEWIERGSVRYPIHAYYVGGHRIWGATGAMIQNLLERLSRV